MPLDLAGDRRHRESREGEPAGRVEPVDRDDEREARDLFEVLVFDQPAVRCAGHALCQRHEEPDELVASGHVSGLRALEELGKGLHS
jgi:hypothetical protein